MALADTSPHGKRGSPPRTQASHSFRPRSENTRERDALRYLYAWADVQQPSGLYRDVFLDLTAVPSFRPEPCSDTALAAFAQLCALRMNVRRVFVTLLSTNTEYVLAEATRTMSLQYDAPDDLKDILWLGTCSFPRSCGINGLAVDGWRKACRLREPPPSPDHYFLEGQSPHYCIVSDTRSHAEYSQTRLARQAQWIRFYCSVPLRDVNGSVIGSLSVMDDRPRYGVSAHELRFLEGSADNVVEHLENAIVRAQRQRSERLIQAVGLFNKQGNSLREWWLAQDDSRLERGGRYEKNEGDVANQALRVDEEFGVQNGDLSNTTLAMRRKMRREVSEGSDESMTNEAMEQESDVTSGNRAAGRERGGQGVSTTDFNPKPEDDGSTEPHLTGENLSLSPSAKRDGDDRQSQVSSTPFGTARRTDSFHLDTASQHTYARATNLIREAMSAEGVICVDATAASSRVKNTSQESPDPDRISSLSSGNSESYTGVTSDSETSHSSHESSKKRCEVTGFSTRNRSTLSGTCLSQQPFELTDKELERLIRRYPHGKTFTFEASGHLYSSSGDDSTQGSSEGTEMKDSPRRPRRKRMNEAQRLRSVMFGARSIGALPSRDYLLNTLLI